MDHKGCCPCFRLPWQNNRVVMLLIICAVRWHDRCSRRMRPLGGKNDVPALKAPSYRCQPYLYFVGARWDVAPITKAYEENTAHVVMECSNVGVCNRVTGSCSCPSGYTGSACQRLACPNDCSGRGTCATLGQVRKPTRQVNS